MGHKRKLLVGLTVAGALSAGFGSSVLVASANERTFVVTLLGGIKHTVTLNIPADTPVDQIKLPGITGKLPILSIQEVTAPQSSTPGPLIKITPGAPAAPGAPVAEPAADTAKDSGAKKSKKGSTDRIVEETSAILRSTSRHRDVDRPVKRKMRSKGGVPLPANPTFSLALPGPAPIGVPNFFIDKFAIPPFLLPIYQAAGIQYGIPWELLAAINEIETDYGRNLNVSSAGAMGWMQFIPSSWKRWGLDANADGKRDPYNPVDAIFSAARYLKAAGAEQDIKRAIFAYNHADWYVDSVMLRARLIGGLPTDLVGSLSGLTQGQFPVAALTRYADDLSEQEATRRVAAGQNAALAVPANPTRHGINLFAKTGSRVIAVQDATVTKMGQSKRLGRFLQLQDTYGNTYTYAHLKSVADRVAVPKESKQSRTSVARELALPKSEAAPTAPASAGRPSAKAAKLEAVTKAVTKTAAPVVKTVETAKQRLFANPTRPAPLKNGGREQILDSGTAVPAAHGLRSYFAGDYGLKRDDVVLKRLVPGRKVIGGTVIGRIGKTSSRLAPHVLFEIRPAGRGAPRIDPKPILDGWKLLESTAIYRSQNKNPFFGENSREASIGQILLLSKQALQHRVLANPRIEVYSCGRRDIQAGIVDRRVLGALEFLAASGLKPTVTSLRCGHGYYTSAGGVSAHSSGNAVDIAKINGVPILGNQGAGSIADLTVRRLLTLQGTLKPAQIISLMTYQNTTNTLAMADHADHLHLGFQPTFNPTTKAGRALESVLKPTQWIKLIDRLNDITNPHVPSTSQYAIKVPVPTRASRAHDGE